MRDFLVWKQKSKDPWVLKLRGIPADALVMTSHLDDFEHTGTTDFDGEDVTVYALGSARDGSRVAAALPRSLQKLDQEAFLVAAEVQRTVFTLSELHVTLVEGIAQLRELGASWGAIGWLVGTTGEAARQRFGVV